MRDFVPQGELADDNIVFALQLAVPDAVLELQPKASLGDFTTGKGNAVGGEFWNVHVLEADGHRSVLLRCQRGQCTTDADHPEFVHRALEVQGAGFLTAGGDSGHIATQASDVGGEG